MSLNIGVAAVYAVGALFIVGGIPLAFWLFASGYRDRQREIGWDRAMAASAPLILAAERNAYRQGMRDSDLIRAASQPGADDDFTEALLSGALHEPVSEEWKSLLGAIQEHERAARAEAAR